MLASVLTTPASYDLCSPPDSTDGQRGKVTRPKAVSWPVAGSGGCGQRKGKGRMGHIQECLSSQFSCRSFPALGCKPLILPLLFRKCYAPLSTLYSRVSLVSCSPGLGGSASARRHIICYGLGNKKPGNDKMRGRRGEREAPLTPLFPPGPLPGGTFSVKLSLTTLQFPALLNHSAPRLGPLLQGPLVIHPLRTRAIYHRGSASPNTHPVHIRLDKECPSLYTCGSRLTRPFLKQSCMVCK